MEQFSVQRDRVRGGIVPHAGWFFSGRLAALVFHAAAQAGQPDVVAVFGGHLGPGNGIIYNDEAWETPLGPMEVDRELTQALMGEFRLSPEGPATNDNTVEVQMPLARYFFPESRLVSLRAPHDQTAVDLGRKTARLAREQGKSLKAFGSTDLTHYGPNYGFSPQGQGPDAVQWVKEVNDQGFIQRALEMDLEGMLEHAAQNHSACSAGGAAAAAAACREMGADSGELLDYYTSYDLMPGTSFVGYAGIVF
jgi:hypothetical protein